MSTPEEAGVTANATTSSYAGGGVGGKFRKKPFRRQATPYDRPPTAFRDNNINSNDSSSSWLTKLVVEPASKLISYGADRFFGSVFRRRLPPQPPESNAQDGLPESNSQDGLSESNSQESDGDQGTCLNSDRDEQEPRIGQCSQPINNSSSHGVTVTELEHLLKQKTFTRSEISYLAELLQSRAAEVSPGDASRINVVSVLDSSRQKEFGSGISEGNKNDGIESSAIVLTPINNSKVLGNDIVSPAELAKSYMGSRTSQVSQSLLGMRNQLGNDGTWLLADALNPPKSPIVSLARRSSVGLSAAENVYITPLSRGRSAIYTMARTPYSRVHPTSISKRSGINSRGFAGPSTSTSSLSPLENDGKYDLRLGTLKRRSSVLDAEIGSVGPIRRIRQKSDLLASRFHHNAHGVGVGSHAKQKPQMNGDKRNKTLKNSGENENESVPRTSYAHIPSKSKEVAAKILQQLEKISPKEKSPGSKLVAMQENSYLKLFSSRLPGQALWSMEDVGTSKMLLNAQDDLKSVNLTNNTLPDVHESSPQQQGKTEGNNPNDSFIPSGRWNSVLNNDSAVSLKASTSGLGAGDSVVKNGSSLPQKKRALRMSIEEGSLELADAERNGRASRSLSNNKGPFEYLHTKPAGDARTTFKSEDNSSMGLSSRSTSELTSGAVTFEKGTSVIAIPASEGKNSAASQSQILTSSVPAFDKAKEANSSNFFSFSSKAADNSPSFPSGSTKRAESAERSSSLANTSMSVGSKVGTFDSETGLHMKPGKVVDTNGKCDDGSSAALTGPLVSRSSPLSFPAASFGDMHSTSTGSAPPFTPLTSSANFLPTGGSTSTAVPFSGSIFGGAEKSLGSGGPLFKFVSSVDPPTTVSVAPETSISETADQRAKIDINPNSGTSSTSYSTVAAATTGSTNSIFKLGSSLNNSTGSSLQNSNFAIATKSPVFGAGTILQGTSPESVPSALVPAHNMNTDSYLGSVPTPSISIGFSSLTSTSNTTSLVPDVGPTPSLFKFGATSAAVSEGSTVSSSASATSSPFSFGSSSSTTTVCSNSAPATPVFSFGGTTVSSEPINTTSSFSSYTSGIFSFGGSPVSSSTAHTVSSSGMASNIFGSGCQSKNSPLFGSPPQSSGFLFSASANAAPPMAFNSSSGTSSGPIFSFTSVSASSPVLGGGFAASPGNNDKMNAEDSMTEDPVPSSSPTPVFGQASASPATPTFAFGSAAPPQNNPFMFNSQQNQVPLQSPSSFQASGSVEFNAGGSFSLGSAGGDKSKRKIVKVSRLKNRKK
ncbi:nuclear pore complex protein NUP1-like [Salvia splendens]|uniref:nuclear pore complex protein NUP1-like n=1 Tax=Salvia splendens TaxID=180675 RepID=UPI001C2524A9|nr:nuclear pore complex protein NUP1-like [Salvia splendens]